MQTVRFEFYLVLYSHCCCWCCSSCCAFASSCPLRQSSSDSRVPNANGEPQIHFWFGCQAPASPVHLKYWPYKVYNWAQVERPSTPPRRGGTKVARWVRLIAARLGYQSRIMAVLCLTARQSPWCLKSAQILAYDVKVSAHPPLGRQPPWHALPCWSSETSPCVQRIEERGLRTMMKVAISSICNFPPFSVVRVRAFVSVYVYVCVCSSVSDSRFWWNSVHIPVNVISAARLALRFLCHVLLLIISLTCLEKKTRLPSKEASAFACFMDTLYTPRSHS